VGRHHKQVHEFAAAPETQSGLSRHLLRAQEEERKRISRELHDETGQALMLLRLQLGMLSPEVEIPDWQSKIQQAVELLDRTIGGLRRIIGRLSPRVLEDLGLLAAIRREARELSKSTGMKVKLHLAGNLGALSEETEVAAYRCVQEALHNVSKHSHARNVNIELGERDQKLRLMIQDDGVGISSKSQAHSRGFGLSGMRERLAVLGGTVRIGSAKKRGTRLRIVLPVGEGKGVRRRDPEPELMKAAAVKRAS
jgi:two-component system, NarL family, sensor histidine kinase UhpB